MINNRIKQLTSVFIGLMLSASGVSFADSMPAISSSTAMPSTSMPTPTTTTQQPPTIVPSPPNTNAKAYILIDANSGYIIAQKNEHQRRAPASLTKLMTLYLTQLAIKSGQITPQDKVRISKKAWQTGGSRMFVKVNSLVPVQELIDGVIVASGNDAATALAQYVGGNQKTFVHMMNAAAKSLGMKGTHFTDPTGLPNPDHYSTAYDLAILTRAIIKDFPTEYKWYNQKWITYNGIKQPNRNTLLWRDPSVDGLKTGHTKAAGYCLISSAIRHGMRLISVVMGTPSENARVNDSEAMLNYGYRFYDTHKLYGAYQTISQQRVYLGENKTVPMGVKTDFYVTVPTGQYKNLKASMELNSKLKAPIVKDETYGKVVISLDGKEIASRPLIALKNDVRGGLFTRIGDHTAMFFHGWFSNKPSKAS